MQSRPRRFFPDSCALFPFEVLNWPCYGQELTQGTVTGAFTPNDFSSSFVAIPEPAHLTMVAGGVLAGVVCLSRRRRTGQEQPRIPTHDSRAG